MKARLLILLILALAAVKGQARNEPRPVKKTAVPVAAEEASAEPIVLEGNKRFKKAELLHAIEQQEESIRSEGPDAATGDDAAFFLEVFYQRRGYANAVVNYEVRGKQLVLTIDEGLPVELGQITFTGNTGISSKKLTPYLLARTSERLGLFQKKPFVEDDLDAGADQVRLYYLSQGYAQVVVEDLEFTPADNGTKMDVRVTIREGPRFFYKVEKLEGDLVYSEEELREALDDLREGPFTEEQKAAIERSLERFYRDHGYYEPKAVVSGGLEEADAGHVVPIRVSLEPGQAYVFGEVKVSGVKYLHPGFVERRFAGMQGENYSPGRIKDQYEKMIRTGLFDDIKIYPKPQRDGLLDLDVKVQEARPREFGFGLGYDTYDGALGSVDYTNRSVFDTGRLFKASLEASFRGYRGNVSITDPWLCDSDYSLTAKIFAEYKDYDVYTKQEVGSRVELGRTFGDLQVAAFLQAKHVRLEDYDISAASLGPPEYDVASTGLVATYDRRDNKVLPHSGYIVSASAEVAPELLSVSYARAVLKGGYYIPWGRSTFMLLGQGGVVYPWGDEDLPIDERFFNGGANTVRSFNEREMGPQDPNGEHIGGEAFTAFTAEWDFPLVGDLYGAVFADAGNLLPLAEDFGLSDMRYALGMGLRYYLPIGPVRLDAALNPDPQEGETSGAVHFGFGFSF